MCVCRYLLHRVVLRARRPHTAGLGAPQRAVEAATPCVLLLSFPSTSFFVPPLPSSTSKFCQEHPFPFPAALCRALFLASSVFCIRRSRYLHPLLARPLDTLFVAKEDANRINDTRRGARQPPADAPQLRLLAHVDFPATLSFKSLPDAHNSALGNRLRDSESESGL